MVKVESHNTLPIGPLVGVLAEMERAGHGAAALKLLAAYGGGRIKIPVIPLDRCWRGLWVRMRQSFYAKCMAEKLFIFPKRAAGAV
ncbi:hypothetical protein CCP2SC5_1860005 [Azospirillaceae bacterium]